MNKYSHFHKYANSEWKYISLSSVECIKGLMKFRYRFSKIRESDSPMRIGNVFYYQTYMDEDIVAVYADLDALIEQCNFNEKQIDMVEMYMNGWTESDIALYTGYTQQNINKILNVVCRRICEENDKNWYYNFLCVGKINAPFTYKKCSVCMEEKPMTEDFFGIDMKNINNYRSVCKECRNGKNEQE